MSEWIDCENRLPEPGEQVIVRGATEEVVGPVELGESYYGPGWFRGNVSWDCITFSHWIPFPQLPKEPNDE